MPRAFQALLLAAGRGTRMKSARAKALHSFLGRPLLDRVLCAVERFGAEPRLIVVGHEGDAVEAAFSGRGEFVRQDPPRGTGHAVLMARTLLARHPDRPVLVVNGDLPLLGAGTLERLRERHVATGAAATLLSAVLDDAGDYGRVRRGGDGRVTEIVEARDASPEVRKIREMNAGVYLFEVPPLLAALERLVPENAQGEYYLTDVIARLVAAGRTVEALAVDDPDEVLGVNTLSELQDLANRERGAIVARLMAAGVTIEDPASTWVEPSAIVEVDAVLRPHTHVEGRSIVRSRASVGPFVRLVDCEVGEGAQILDHCLLRDCSVGADAQVGPFAHIRPESRIGRKAKVGNFVELKKTSLGEGSKASHLSYLGDADIGPDVNVGAGTITCNYDGEKKHPTHIEAGAFIGSDTILVAPVRVGAGAYVAAGSAITHDVPADALALGRARQVTKPGWAKARRAARGVSGPVIR